MTGQLLVSAAQTDITPPVGLLMDGYVARHELSSGIHDPLLGQVLILADNTAQLAILTLDVLAVSAGFVDTLRQNIGVVLNISSDAIIICASHTHAGPAGLHDWPIVSSDAALNPQLINVIQSRLITAAQEACNHLCPAHLVYGTGEIEGIGRDRNWPRPAPDNRVTALRFDDQDGKAIAVLFHYACHPTILGTQTEYSADFPGAARERIKTCYPEAVCLYLNGAAGNISTRDTRRSQTFDEVIRLGNLLGDKVLAVLEHPQRSHTDLHYASRTIDLPFREFSISSQRSLQQVGNNRIDQTRREGARIEAGLAQVFANQTSQSASLTIFQIGHWKLMSVPGEAFNELAATLKRRSPFALVIGYANDYLGYFPTQEALDAATYEALASPFDARALNLIEKVFTEYLESSR